MDTLLQRPRLGVLGGTFNPVHLGHLIMAQDAIERFELTKVMFVPCAQPPHKSSYELPVAHHRLAMLEAAIEGDLQFEVSDMEIQRGGTSYTIDSMRILAEHHPDMELCFIIGADSLMELHLWKDIELLLKLCRIVTIARPGIDLAALAKSDLKLPAPWPERLLADVRGGHLIDISSTDIRYRVAEGMSIRYLVSPAVDMYITEHSLYRR
ncbi:MAG: nicotinate-nucleotide adenylyltransferase [bacterium]